MMTRATFLWLLLCFLHGGCARLQTDRVVIDDVLHRSDARQGTLGPTGKRLFTERLDEGLGFRGQFSYIHYAKIADPIVFCPLDWAISSSNHNVLKQDKPFVSATDRVDWFPSHLVTHSRFGRFVVTERKFITDDDTLVDLVTVTNDSDVSSECLLEVSSGFARDRGPDNTLTGAADFRNVRGHAVLLAPRFTLAGNEPSLRQRVSIRPGQSVSFRIVLSFQENAAKAEQAARAWATRPDALAHHKAVYQKWFDDNCPRFECDDPYITRLYWYRWFVARHCLSRACTGNLPYPYFFEGTHQPHFPRLISFSSPHIIAETRWLRDPQYAFGQVRNHCLNPDDTNRFFISAWINEKRGDYNNWIVKAAWEAFQVHPDRHWLREVIEPMSEDVRGTLRQFDRNGNFLPTPRKHGTTGMEYQPSFFYFNDKYDNSRPDAPLERGDYAAYLYGNAKALSEAWRFLGNDARATEFEELAEKTRVSCLARLWDPADRFCYAIRETDGAVARVREVVGFYPFMSRLLPDQPEYIASLAYLVDPAEFWTAYPPATVTQKCPAYTPHVATWPAAGGKTHGCMWNGPAWPHAASVILDVMAIAIREYRQAFVTPEQFWHVLDRYTHLQYENGDLSRPMVTEYYDGQSGSPDPTGCPDYFHSTYCDLVIRHVVGLQPSNAGRVVVDPIPGPLRRFSLRGVRYRGHELDIVYNSADPGPEGGLTVRVDGRPAAHRMGTLGRVEFDLPTGRRPEK